MEVLSDLSESEENKCGRIPQLLLVTALNPILILYFPGS